MAAMLELVVLVLIVITSGADVADKPEIKENSLEWFFVKSDRKHGENDPYMIDPNEYNRIQPVKIYTDPTHDPLKTKPKVIYDTPKVKPEVMYTPRMTESVPPEDSEVDSGSGWTDDAETEAGSGQYEDTNYSPGDNTTYEESSAEITTGSGLYTETTTYSCDERRCKYGGVCDPRADELSCLCNFSCINNNTSRGLVCGSDRQIYQSHCELRQRSCETQTHITSAPFQLCIGSPLNSDIPKCQEKSKHETYWSPWSVWMRSGNKDFRIRHCDKDTAPGSRGRFCSGRLVETRACPVEQGDLCRGRNDSVEYQKFFKCRGVNIMDIAGTDNIYLGAMNYEDCWYSLLDTKSSNYKHHKWSHIKLLTRGSHREWCQSRKRFIPFLSHQEHCHRSLDHYCHITTKCKYRYGRDRQKPDDMAHICWKRFTVANRLPSGIATMRSTALLCHRFAIRSKLGITYGSRDVHFATMYDTRRKMPAYSLAVLESISDVGWPAVPSLIDRALVNDGRFVSWLFSSPEKGLMFESEVDKDLQGNTCHLGENQAMDSDYKHTGLRAGALITPNIVGCSPAAKIATRATTNTAPMYVSQYYAWARATDAVRNYAEHSCGVPVDRNPGGVYCNGASEKDNQSKLFLVSGAVPTQDLIEVIGNDVTIPSMFWLAGCCVRGDGNVTSFALYMRNSPDFPVKKLPVADIEIVLAEMYKPTKPVNIKLFPGKKNVCRRSENNDIDNLLI